MRSIKSSFSALVLILSLVASFTFTPNANAASGFDTTYISTSKLTVTDTSGNDADISSSWSKYIRDSTYWNGYDFSTLSTSFQTALNSGRWTVNEYDFGSHKAAYVYWTEDASLALGWGTNNGGLNFVSTGSSTGAKFCSFVIGNNNQSNPPGQIFGQGGGCDSSGYTQPALYGSNGTLISYNNAPLGGSAVFKNFFTYTDQPNYPAGYTGPMIPTTPLPPPPAAYVAMGDSFSSGEGVGSYEAGSDAPNVNMCHRSSQSYPRVIAADLNLGSTAFVACSGATTNTLFEGGSASGAWGEPPQMDALSATTQRVTLTIGGNDLGFADVLNSCVNSPKNNGWGCSNDSTITTEVSDRMNALAGTTSNVSTPDGSGVIRSILSVLEEINTRTSGKAKIYIGGYPHLFGSNLSSYEASSSAPGGGFCAPDVGGSYSYADALWFNDRTNQVNTIMQSAVNVAKNEGIMATYVPGVAFGGHAWCDSGSPIWFNGIVLSSGIPPAPLPESMHPNYAGVIGGYVPEFEYLMN